LYANDFPVINEYIFLLPLLFKKIPSTATTPQDTIFSQYALNGNT